MKTSILLVVASLACRGPALKTNPAKSQPAVPATATTARALAAASPPRVYRVGGDVTAPVVVSRAEAKITKEMKCRGQVLLDAVIDAQGHPTEVRDISPSPDAFTRAHAEALEHWVFRPATRHGQPVPAYFNVTISVRCL